MRSFLFLVLVLQSIYCSSQQQVVHITGKVINVPGATWIEFYGTANGHTTLTPSGEFDLVMALPRPGILFFYTDKSRNNVFWATEGKIELIIEGWQLKENDTVPRPIRIQSIKGPHETETFTRILNEKVELSRDSIIGEFITQYPSSKMALHLLSQFVSDSATKANFFSLVRVSDQDSIELETFRNALARDSFMRRGRQIDNFTQTDVTGGQFSLSSINAKYILLDFWSSDCGPCRRQHPDLINIYKENFQKGFAIVSISLDDDLEEWKKAVKHDKLLWPQVSDLQGWDNVLAQKYFVSRIPFNILIDENRRIVTADLRPDELKKLLSELLPQ